MNITYFVAASRDGFIARPDGDVSWLDDLQVDPDEAGLTSFFESVDGLLMGRKTYDFVFNYGSWPYEDKPTWVFTHSALQPLDGAKLTPTESIDEAIDQATAQGLSHLWLVGGGQLASSFLGAGLLTHLSLSEMPIDLGHGIPLFANHSLDKIPAIERTEETKPGFRQIDITIQATN